MSKINIIPIFIPHLGCPNDCVFCNQKKITGISTHVTGSEVESNILEYLDYFYDKSKDVEIAFYGGSFTALEIDKQIEFLSVAKKYKDSGKIDRIRLSTRPDFIDRDILKIQLDYGVDIIELGVQSMDDEVLNLSNRGHSSKDVIKAVESIRETKITLGLQQMIGLPGDTYEKSLYTTRELIKLKPDFVRIYPTLIVKDTELERMYYNNEYTPMSLESSVEDVSKFLMLYMKEDIKVIRIGLQNTESISTDGDVVGGPFHESYRELVEGLVLNEMLYNYLTKFIEIDNMTVFGSGRNISLLVGQKSKYKDLLKSKYNIKNLKYKQMKIDDTKLKLEINSEIYNIDLEYELGSLVDKMGI